MELPAGRLYLENVFQTVTEADFVGDDFAIRSGVWVDYVFAALQFPDADVGSRGFYAVFLERFGGSGIGE